MPVKKLTLTPVPTSKPLATPGVVKAKNLKVKFAKKPISKALFKKKIKKSQVPPKQPKRLPSKKITFKPVLLNTSSLKKFAEVRTTRAATAAIDKNYKNNLGGLIGTAHSTMTVLAYQKMESEFRKRLKKASTPAAKLKVHTQWKKVISAASRLNQSANGSSLSAAKLNQMSKALKANKVAHAEAIKMAKSTLSTVTSSLTAATKVTAILLPQSLADFTKIPDLINVIEDLCDEPIRGSFTHHHSASFSLQVRFTYWCPTWSNPFRTCTGTITLAGVSFTVGINVQYEIGCCGASVSGSGYVNACGTIIGITACAGCRATVTGAVSLGHSPTSGGNCSFMMSATASIVCQAAGITVLNLNHGFNFQVNGPCPPVPLPCS